MPPAGPLGEWFATLGAPRLSILIYHRVRAAPDPLFPGEIDARQFEQRMAIVARRFQVMTLAQALALRDQHRLPRRALVITFDDGYADNAEVALPILQRLGLRATFFVSTGFLDGGCMWNDAVIECVRGCRHDIVDLSEFGLGPMPAMTVPDRGRLIDALLPRIKYLELDARETALRRLQGLTGVAALPRDLMMRSQQVIELHRAGMEIGGHTVHHPILKLLPDAMANAEIGQGRDRLQQLTQAPVLSFAYPNGRPGQDYDERHVEMVRALGFRGAVSTAPGVATWRADAYQLPRFTPWDRRPQGWAAKLAWHRLHATRFEQVRASAST